MKINNLKKLFLIAGLIPLFLTSCNTNVVVGPQGEDVYSLLTGHGNPTIDEGNIGDSYIDLDTWDYYVKNENSWVKNGNIKGDSGVSVTSTYINDDGDLIVVFSNGETTNAGHVKDVGIYTVKFYCDDLLVNSQFVKHGEKIILPELEDFTVKHWYIDKEFEYEWLWYGCFVTENMSLYGDYTPVIKSVSFDKNSNISIDEYGYGFTQKEDKEICVSKAIESPDYLTTIDDFGILFNKEDVGCIAGLELNISEENFLAATLYYGNNPLSFDSSISLIAGKNTIDLPNPEYFTIQNYSGNPININSLVINYSIKTKFHDENLPTVVINTKNSQDVTSRVNYVDCNVSTIGADKDVSELKAQIKVRGNSTAACPKKPYRIKLDKKNSLFGYSKAKNWALLADYMDGSKMHNFAALKFAKMIKDKETFSVNPLHVNVVLNGENVGIYEFCEHIDAKEGRLNIEQDNLWEKSFNEINFYIERDVSTISDPNEIEGETYFRVQLEGQTPLEHVFALKYPEKEDFSEELEGGEIDDHEAEFFSFFNALKSYITDICSKFIAYSTDADEFSNIASSVDVQSLAEYATVDQVSREGDHERKSYKMYRANGGLLKFGPNWDYDSIVYGLPYRGTYVESPFTEGWNHFESTYIGDKWGLALFNDVNNGRPLFKNIWSNISDEMIESYLNDQHEELNRISKSVIYECEKWMNNQYHSLFDNQRYYWKWVSTQTPYLKAYYS